MTTPPAVDADVLAFAADTAAAAAALTLEWFRGRDLHVEHKGDGSEVTVADRAAEELIRTAVLDRYPDDTVIGEEGGTTPGRSDRTWIIDPIDGTASFVRGVPLYSSLLAVTDAHGPAVGVVSIPALDEVVVAGRGRGATHNGGPTTVSTVATVADACVSSSSFDQPWWPAPALDAVTASGAKTRTWGDGYGYLLVATGRIEAMIDPPLHTYDIAALLTVIPESGGRITRWDGRDDLADGMGWMASNGLVHDELLALLAASG